MADRLLTVVELYDRQGGRDRIAALTRKQERGQVQIAIVAAKDSAEAEAVSWLSGRYGDDLPATTATTPEALKGAVAARTVYLLATAANDEVHPTIIDRASDALSWYRAVSKGQASLDLAPAVATDQVQSRVLVARAASDAPLSREALSEWWS